MRGIAAVVLVLAHSVAAFYLPGVAPRDYAFNEKVEMNVNKIWSSKTQLPYRYYSLPVCRPKERKEESENLGETLLGDRIESSLYELYMKYNERCKVLCRRELTKPDVRNLVHKIDNDYYVNWILDNLPASVRLYNEDNPEEVYYERGFPLGFTGETKNGDKMHFLFNHIHFIVKYHTEEENKGSRIVGFEIEPYSVKHNYEGEWSDENPPQLRTCNPAQPVTRDMEPQRVDSPGEVVYTYDVEWQESDTPWAHRWDVFLSQSRNREIHWFSIVNSIVIVLFLTGMIAMILMRALYRDIAQYNEETADDREDETGWKMVHGDVFRPPSGFFGPMLLSVFVGSGMQILMMVVSLMVFAVLGFLSPANRGGLLTALLLLFVFMGSFAGYFSARIYKMFRGKAWKRNTLLTAFAFPGTVFTTVIVLNFFVWHEHSSASIPFWTLFSLVVLWFGVSTPLVFLGSYLGFSKEEIKPPVRVNDLVRTVPPQPWYMNPLPSILVGGLLPFGAVFIELFFIMSSLWLSEVYYVFGILAIVLAILIITCAEISIVMCYFQLCAEDYNWWWRSFLTSGSSALYLFLYSILYFMTKLEITKFVSGLLYFGYMGLISWGFFLLTGSIGFLATFGFVRKIYSSIKVD